MKRDTDHTYTLTIHVHNQPGVLVRCAQIFGRRGHNIESLQVNSDPNHDELSTMNITAYGEPKMMHQIVLQLQKLIDVLTVKIEEK